MMSIRFAWLRKGGIPPTYACIDQSGFVDLEFPFPCWRSSIAHPAYVRQSLKGCPVPVQDESNCLLHRFENYLAWAALISAQEKSIPLNSSGRFLSRANAYAKTSPKLRPAG